MGIPHFKNFSYIADIYQSGLTKTSIHIECTVLKKLIETRGCIVCSTCFRWKILIPFHQLPMDEPRHMDLKHVQFSWIRCHKRTERSKEPVTKRFPGGPENRGLLIYEQMRRVPISYGCVIYEYFMCFLIWCICFSFLMHITF